MSDRSLWIKKKAYTIDLHIHHHFDHGPASNHKTFRSVGLFIDIFSNNKRIFVWFAFKKRNDYFSFWMSHPHFPFKIDLLGIDSFRKDCCL